MKSGEKKIEFSVPLVRLKNGTDQLKSKYGPTTFKNKLIKNLRITSYVLKILEKLIKNLRINILCS